MITLAKLNLLVYDRLKYDDFENAMYPEDMMDKFIKVIFLVASQDSTVLGCTSREHRVSWWQVKTAPSGVIASDVIASDVIVSM